MLAAGELNTMIEILEQRKEKNSIGELNTVWCPVDRAWAKLEPISTRDFVASGSEGTALTAKITVRDTIDVRDYHKIKIMDTGMIYQVQGVIHVPVDRKKSCLCSTGVP